MFDANCTGRELVNHGEIMGCHNNGRTGFINIMEDLENHYIIQSHPNWMAPTTYTLTDIGRNIAVELIKQKDDK